MNVVPWPGILSTVMNPPYSRTVPWATVRVVRQNIIGCGSVW
jgi:hypothetical protein